MANIDDEHLTSFNAEVLEKNELYPWYNTDARDNGWKVYIQTFIPIMLIYTNSY